MRWMGCLLAVAMTPTTGLAAVAADYLQGYARAVLDLRFPGRTLEVRSAYDDGRLALADTGCGPSPERAAVENALIASGRFARVTWEETPACRQQLAATPMGIEPAAGGAAAAPAAASPPDDQTPAAVAVEALPVDELFKPLMADPRQPQFSLKYHRYKAQDSFNAASVSFGDYFGFASRALEEYGVSQIGLQGAVFAVFNLDAPSFDLVNADYWLGIPLSYRRGPWSFLTRIYHQSSHLGDEFLLGNPDFERINLSYEDWELLASYEHKRWRFYGGGGVILHSEPDLDPLHVQVGAEYREPDFFRNFQLVAATDWQADQEQNWHPNRSYQIGFAFASHEGRELRLMLEHFRGFSPNGQFFDERLRYSGLGMYFDF